jgi:hypothetical protein
MKKYYIARKWPFYVLPLIAFLMSITSKQGMADPATVPLLIITFSFSIWISLDKEN